MRDPTLLLDTIQEGQQHLRDLLADAEEAFAKVCVCPATLDLKIRLPPPHEKHFRVGQLHFDGQSFSYTEPQKKPVSCRVCGSPCQACLKRNPPKNSEAVDVQTISDTDTLCAIVNALPRMYRRLVEDSQVSPDDMMEAVKEAQNFIAHLKIRA